jgi:hypothetical protein
MILSRKEKQKYRRERNSLFVHIIPHVYIGLNRREYELIMERKILGDYNKIKSENKIRENKIVSIFDNVVSKKPRKCLNNPIAYLINSSDPPKNNCSRHSKSQYQDA